MSSMDTPGDTFDHCNFDELDEILSSCRVENCSFIDIEAKNKGTMPSNYPRTTQSDMDMMESASGFSFQVPEPVTKWNKYHKLYDCNGDLSQEVLREITNKKARLSQEPDSKAIPSTSTEKSNDGDTSFSLLSSCNIDLNSSINPNLYTSPWNKSYENEIQDQQNDVLEEELSTVLSIPNFFEASFSTAVSQRKSILSLDWAKNYFKENASHSVQQHNYTLRGFSQSSDFTQQDSSFFGLSQKVKTLFEKIKNITKLYEWQEECLNLKSLKERKNLIYALPTSGGKTLVAEILLLREIIQRQKNVLFILPFVSIVQEKVWDLSPFQVAFQFNVEEYAGHKGALPPKKRRFKNTVYVATIEKAFLIVNQLYANNRLDEIGLIIVDEIHLIADRSRGHLLETILATILYLKKDIHIVGMSATIGNIHDLADFLQGTVYTKNFRPVELNEFVKCNNSIYEVVEQNLELYSITLPGTFNSNDLDRDQITELVNEVIHTGSCLIFCATKKNCENVCLMLIDKLSPQILNDRKNDRETLLANLNSESLLCPVLKKCLPYGVAYHHSGLTSNERMLIEEAYKSGVINVICCTSTLATGVNLPAQRVIIRSPYVARDFISLSKYKQMVGRAGRAGLKSRGDSILVCQVRDFEKVKEMLSSPMDIVLSAFNQNDFIGFEQYILNLVSLNIANCRADIIKATKCTLMYIQAISLDIDVMEKINQILAKLISEIVIKPKGKKIFGISKMTVKICDGDLKEGYIITTNSEDETTISIYNNCPLLVTIQGEGTVKAGFSIEQAQMVYMDLKKAKAGLILSSNLHLLYLMTPNELALSFFFDYKVFYEACMCLNSDEIATAEKIGLNEARLHQLVLGNPLTGISERIQKKFFLALMLNDLWKDIPILTVAQKFNTSRGFLQHLQASASTFASQILRFCESFDDFQIYRSLFADMTQRLLYCCQKELLPLMELPSVKKARATELYEAGFKDLKSIAKAAPSDLVKTIKYLNYRTARQIISSAKIISIKKMEDLQEEAADVMDFS